MGKYFKHIIFRSFRLFYRIRQWFRWHFTRAGTAVLFSIFISAVMGLDTYRALAYQIFTLLSCLMGIAILRSFFFRSRIRAVRELPRFGTAGEPLVYRVSLRNTSRRILPKGLYLIENIESPWPDFEAFLRTPEPWENRRNPFDRAVGFYRWQWLVSRQEMASIKPRAFPATGSGDQAVMRMDILPLRRGELRFTGYTVARPDPFGLFSALSYTANPQSVIILPRRYPLPPFQLPGGRRFHAGGVALTASVGDSEEFVSLREYRPGDPLRRIHWKSWARTGKPVVKEFQEEFYVRHALILDTFQEPEYSEVFEAAVSVAASFACTIQTQESLLDLMFVGTEPYCFTVGRSLAHEDRILEILASVRPCRDKAFSSLSSLVSERGDLLSGCICVLLGWDKMRQDFVKQVQAMGIPAKILVIIPPASGRKPEDADILSDLPENVCGIDAGKIAEGLCCLGNI